MARAIDSYELIKKLTLDTSKGFYGEFMDGSEVAYTSREVVAAINDMPTLTQPNEWISVEERMPEVGDLVVYADDSMWGYQYGICRVCRKEKAFDFWMPLQEPPDRRPTEGEEDTI